MTRRQQKLDPAIRRVRLDNVTIFEISEGELEALERGSPESLFLNLGIATVAFALLWWKSRRSLKNVASDIRSRMPPEGIQEDSVANESGPA